MSALAPCENRARGPVFYPIRTKFICKRTLSFQTISIIIHSLLYNTYQQTMASHPMPPYLHIFALHSITHNSHLNYAPICLINTPPLFPKQDQIPTSQCTIHIQIYELQVVILKTQLQNKHCPIVCL
jgi:hypothetical protein